MIGIDYDIINKIMQVNDLNAKSIRKDTSNIIDSINVIETCYQGNYIGDIFDGIIAQQDELKKIESIVRNYTSILSSVKDSYVCQDKKTIEYLDYVSSKIKK
jgi:hypothetical protein